MMMNKIVLPLVGGSSAIVYLGTQSQIVVENRTGALPHAGTAICVVQVGNQRYHVDASVEDVEQLFDQALNR